MPDYMTVQEAARLWGVSDRRVTVLCKEGRLPGAEKTGKFWRIPSDTAKPADHRLQDSSHTPKVHAATVPSRKDTNHTVKTTHARPLPLGQTSFAVVSDSFYYVDQTLLIRDLIDTKAKITMITRPAGFGKTLAMDMIRLYFERSESDTSHYFKHRKVWTCGDSVRGEQGQYPVITLSLGSLTFNSWEKTTEAFRELIRDLYRKAQTGLPAGTDSDAMSEIASIYRKYTESKELSEVSLVNSLKNLVHMIHLAHQQTPVLLIDDYDQPIRQGTLYGYGQEATLFLRNLLTAACKDNSELNFAVLFGETGMMQDAAFRELGPTLDASVFEETLDGCLGFDREQLQWMTEAFRCTYLEPDIREVCGGYHVGARELYRPEAVIRMIYQANAHHTEKAISSERVLLPAVLCQQTTSENSPGNSSENFTENSSENPSWNSSECPAEMSELPGDGEPSYTILTYRASLALEQILSRVAKGRDERTLWQLDELMQGGTLTGKAGLADLFTPEKEKDSAASYYDLLSAGYLTAESVRVISDGSLLCQVKIPNRECRRAFVEQFALHYERSTDADLIHDLQETCQSLIVRRTEDRTALLQRKAISDALYRLLRLSINNFPEERGTYYPRLVLGLRTMLEDFYEISYDRNREGDVLRILLEPKDQVLPAMILQMHMMRDNSVEPIRRLAKNSMRDLQKLTESDAFCCATGVYCYSVVFNTEKVCILLDDFRKLG